MTTLEKLELYSKIIRKEELTYGKTTTWMFIALKSAVIVLNNPQLWVE